MLKNKGCAKKFWYKRGLKTCPERIDKTWQTKETHACHLFQGIKFNRFYQISQQCLSTCATCYKLSHLVPLQLPPPSNFITSALTVLTSSLPTQTLTVQFTNNDLLHASITSHVPVFSVADILSLDSLRVASHKVDYQFSRCTQQTEATLPTILQLHKVSRLLEI